MRFNKILILLAVSLLSQMIIAQPWWESAYDFKLLDVNRISIPVNNIGGLNYRFGGTYWNYNSKENYIVFDQGLWVIGKINGDLHLAFKQWSTLYSPGPIINNNAAMNLTPEDSLKYRVYKIEIADTLNPGIDYMEWPADLGAPINEYGKPVIYNDQSLWTIYNGMDSSLSTRKWWNDYKDSLPVFPVEIHNMVFASEGKQVDWLKDIVFFEWKIINKGSATIDSTYFGLWTDIDFNDLLNYPAVDSTLQLGYCWSKSDTGYYLPLSVGYSLKYGPTLPSNGDSAVFNGSKKNNHKNLNLTSFHGIGDDSYQHPLYGPLSSLNYAWNFAKGLDGEGNVIVDPTNGLPTTFPFAGDPVTNSGYLFPDHALSSGAGFVMFSGPVNIAPQDTQWVMAALIVATGSDYRDAIVNLRSKVTTIQSLPYDQLVTKTSLIPIPETPPNDFYLSQNYPNPFNNETRIVFEVPKTLNVTISIFDVLGNKLSEIVNAEYDAGKYVVKFSGNKYASGIYFYEIKAGSFIQTKKMIYLK